MPDPSPELEAAVLDQLARCRGGSWRSLAVEYLARRETIPSGELIRDRLTTWEQHLADYGRHIGEAEPEEWAAALMQIRVTAGNVDAKAARIAWAMVWLDIVGQTVTCDRIATLEPWVRLAGVSFVDAKAWQDLLACGEVPTREAVERHLAEQARHAVAGVVGRERDVVAFVAAYVARRGVGPTWREVGGTFGWNRAQFEAVICDLTGRGFLSFTEEKRSLRPGPNAAKVAA
ncbi:hypothetical protein ACQEVF_58110 [Nonomuraea polychroma]|uniref:hypothetical protein n=1 Tax=Nonomuraea polychroma TaxID=46176 RepID=UPI003D93E11B